MDRSARFSGKTILGKHMGPPYYRFNAAENQWFFSTYHISDDTLPDYYDALVKLDVAFIDGYPSALYMLAKWINNNGLSRKWRPGMINTTAETLADFQRHEIQEAFGCKVYSHYSSSEGAPFITECSAGKKHPKG